MNQNMQNGQQGQQNQNNQNGKPTLSWSQPTQPTQVTKPASAQTPPTSQPVQVPPLKTLPAGTEKNAQKTIAIIGGIIVLCLLAVWGMVSLRHRPEVAVNNEGTTPTEEVAPVGTTAPTETAVSQNSAPSVVEPSGALPVTVATPQPAGMSVAVSNVSVSVPTWIVVYKNNSGVAGNALGAGLFLPGGPVDAVPLLRATEAGQSYLVGESVDNGDRVFDLHGDAQVKDAQGTPLFVTFQAN